MTIDAGSYVEQQASSADLDDAVELTIAFRKDVQDISGLPPTTTLSELRHIIEQMTCVASRNQKLLPARAKGIANLNQVPPASSPSSSTDGTRTRSVEEDQRTLQEVGIPSRGLRVMVVGTPSKELEDEKAVEDYERRRNGPRQYHPSMLRGTQPRNTTTPGASFSPFASIQPHPSTPPSSPLYAKVTDFLTRLANDPGIRHICQLHEFKVGTLTELLPWESPELLGLNENAGQKIYLRLRTDDAEGFRNYKTTRRVLVHELAHNRVADHPPEFKILNSELNAQIEAFEKQQIDGTHRFIEGDVYDPDTASAGVEGAGDGAGRTLGGQRLGGPGPAQPISAAERRQQILVATMKRLEKEEQEIEEGCGSGA